MLFLNGEGKEIHERVIGFRTASRLVTIMQEVPTPFSKIRSEEGYIEITLRGEGTTKSMAQRMAYNRAKKAAAGRKFEIIRTYFIPKNSRNIKLFCFAKNIKNNILA